MNPTSNFFDKAKGMTRNPLGIIGLFISLVYGIASAVLGFGIDHFKVESERLPLIWFTILFPFFILIAFIYLVIYHHGKLYGPADFKDEGNFIKTLDPLSQKLRVQSEVNDIQKEITDSLVQDQNDQNEIKSLNTNTLTDKYLIAEDLALRAFEQGKKVSIKRHSELAGKNKAINAFDAIALSEKWIYCIDIRYTVHGSLSRILRNKISNSFHSYRDAIGELDVISEVKIILIVVSENDNIEILTKEVQDLTYKMSLSIDTFVYKFDDLKSQFGYENVS